MTLAQEEAADAERRAQLYRDQQQRRVAFQTWLWSLRKGNLAAWRAFHETWDPVYRALAEQAMPGVPPEEDPYYDPLQQREQVNVGT